MVKSCRIAIKKRNHVKRAMQAESMIPEHLSMGVVSLRSCYPALMERTRMNAVRILDRLITPSSKAH